MHDIVNILNDFQNKKEENRSRQDYIDQLKTDIMTYYSYNDYLIEKFMNLFPLTEVYFTNFLYIKIYLTFCLC